MYCHICGTQLPEFASFCPGCGRSLKDHPLVLQRSPAPVEPETVPAPAPVCETTDPAEAIDTAPIAPDDAPAENTPDDIPEESAPEPESLHLPETTDVLPEPDPSDPPKPAPEPAPKVRKRRPALIPGLIMAGLVLTGIALFFLFPFGDTGLPPETTAPVMEDNGKPPLPNRNQDEDGRSDDFVPTDGDCFQIDDGAIRFLPERYNGGAVLVIPNEIDEETVTAIANSGFAGMEGVTTVILPDTLERIDDNAFEDCVDLRGIYVPSSVTSIGRRAFFGCISMESVSIPMEVTSIGGDAFGGCASLMYMFYEGTYEQWTELYNEYVTPFTYACCSDGEYYHGVYTP